MKILRESGNKVIVEVNLEDFRCPVCGSVIEPKREWEICKRCGMIKYREERRKISIDDRYEVLYPEYKGKKVECDVGQGYMHIVLLDTRKSGINVYIPLTYRERKRGELAKIFEEFLYLSEEYIETLSGKKVEEKKRTSINYVALPFELKIKVLSLMSKGIEIANAFYNYVKEVRK